jgi:flagellar biogenesis protein FliO
MKLDFRRTVDVAVALGACVALVYLMGWGVERLFRGR